MGRNLNPTQKARLDASLLDAYGDGERYAPCVWCGIALDVFGDAWERDRIDPSGTYAMANVMPACRGCNGDRGSATDGDWSDGFRLYDRTDPRPMPTLGDAILRERRRAAADAALARDRRRREARGAP